jgi:hypothetical protein
VRILRCMLRKRCWSSSLSLISIDWKEVSLLICQSQQRKSNWFLHPSQNKMLCSPLLVGYYIVTPTLTNPYVPKFFDRFWDWLTPALPWASPSTFLNTNKLLQQCRWHRRGGGGYANSPAPFWEKSLKLTMKIR